MGTFDNIKNKVSDLVDKNSDKISEGMEKAGDFIDSKTGGKHTDKIETGKGKLKSALDGLDGKDDDFADRVPPTPPAETPPAATPPAATPPAATPPTATPSTATPPGATPPGAMPPAR